MKSLFLILFVIFCLKLNAQDISEASTEDMLHDYIKEFPEKTKQQLFETSIKCIYELITDTLSFKIEYQDKDIGTIISNGVISNVDLGSGWASDNNIKFIFNIDVKDNKMKLSFKKIILCSGGGKEHTEYSKIKVLHKFVKKKFDFIVEEIVKSNSLKSDF